MQTVEREVVARHERVLAERRMRGGYASIGEVNDAHDARRRSRAIALALIALLLMLSLALAACGGVDGVIQPGGPAIARFESDRASYYVGERARLSATYSGGTGRIEPGSMAITSGQTIETPVLAGAQTFRLVVTDGQRTTQRERTLDVRYRERTRAIPMPFAVSEHVAVLLDDGSVLVVGGEEPASAPSGKVWRFDPATETFTEYAQLATGRTAHVALATSNGKVLVYGGTRNLVGSPVAEIIERTPRAVRAARTQPVGSRVYATATLLADGRVLIAGGGGGGLQSSAELFDPVAETFTAIANGPVARYAHSATRLQDGRVLIYGGFPVAGGQVTLPAELYEPAANRFVQLQSPEPGLRAEHAAIAATDGSVWILGGEDADGTPLRSVWRFDPAANRFERLQDGLTARTYARVTLLSDSRLLLVGGETLDAGFGSSLTELLTPGGLRVNGPGLASPRVLHSVTPLVLSGKVLVIGGLGANRNILGSAEIFE